MKKYSYFVGLLVFHPLISARYSSFTTSVINSNHYSLPLKHAKHTQAVIPAAQTAPDKKYKRNITVLLLCLFWLYLLARFYAIEKSHRTPGSQLESAVDTNVQNRGSLWHGRKERTLWVKEVIGLIFSLESHGGNFEKLAPKSRDSENLDGRLFKRLKKVIIFYAILPVFQGS